MIITIFWYFIYIFFPAFVIFLCRKYIFLEKVGSVVLCYIAGLIIGNTGLLPSGIHKIQELISMAAIPLALPLLLFTIDVKHWMKMAGKTFLSLFVALISLLIVLIAGFFIFKGDIEAPHKIAGLYIGVYTGGTPNLAALTLALGLDENLFMKINMYDILLSGLYIFFLITVAQKLFLKFLPKYKTDHSENIKFTENQSELTFLTIQKSWKELLRVLGLSVLVAGASGGAGFLVPEDFMMLIVILSITSLSLILSRVENIRNMSSSFPLGMYFILVFCFVVASMADVSKVIELSMPLFLYLALAIAGTIVLHIIFAKLFRIDTDTVIITSVAMVTSPPFVPLVANALHNKEIILSGLTIGLIGYAIGNYLGVILSFVLEPFI